MYNTKYTGTTITTINNTPSNIPTEQPLFNSFEPDFELELGAYYYIIENWQKEYLASLLVSTPKQEKTTNEQEKPGTSFYSGTFYPEHLSSLPRILVISQPKKICYDSSGNFEDYSNLITEIHNQKKFSGLAFGCFGMAGEFYQEAILYYPEDYDFGTVGTIGTNYSSSGAVIKQQRFPSSKQKRILSKKIYIGISLPENVFYQVKFFLYIKKSAETGRFDFDSLRGFDTEKIDKINRLNHLNQREQKLIFADDNGVNYENDIYREIPMVYYEDNTYPPFPPPAHQVQYSPTISPNPNITTTTTTTTAPSTYKTQQEKIYLLDTLKSFCVSSKK